MERRSGRRHAVGMTDTDANKKIVTEFIDGLFSRGDLGSVDAYLSDAFVDHDPPFGTSGDREGMRTVGQMVRGAFPDWHSELHLLIAEGDLVAEHFTASGTHRGEIMGVAPTGGEMFLKGINIFRLRDGRISERWGRLDDFGFLQQLGVIPNAGG
jgi:predicted ester cyclase